MDELQPEVLPDVESSSFPGPSFVDGETRHVQGVARGLGVATTRPRQRRNDALGTSTSPRGDDIWFQRDGNPSSKPSAIPARVRALAPKERCKRCQRPFDIPCAKRSWCSTKNGLAKANLEKERATIRIAAETGASQRGLASLRPIVSVETLLLRSPMKARATRRLPCGATPGGRTRHRGHHGRRSARPTFAGSTVHRFAWAVEWVDRRKPLLVS